MDRRLVLLAFAALAAGFAWGEEPDFASEARTRLEEKLTLVYGATRPGNLAHIRFERTDWKNRQEYAIESSPTGIVLSASDAMGFSYAAADLLHELGYRRFAPHPSWEILPPKPPAGVRLRKRSRPDYRFRHIWGWLAPDQRGTGDHAEWNFANRMLGESIRTGHSYERFVRQNRAFFAEHPECLALVKGERKGSKLCISNPLLRERFVRYELDQVLGDPTAISVSAEPSDGEGWCECAACAKLGSPSDRAVRLANEVAKAVRAEFPGKVVGMYAYNAHSPPPTIPVEKGVVVFVATGFLREGWSVERLIEEWGRRTYVGIREYYYAKGLPGEGAATDTAYLARTIPAFHAQNAHWMNAEASDAWIPALMGFNVAAALLWDVKTDPEAVKADLVARAFPSCRAAARRFFDLIDGGAKRPVCEDLFARMYEALDEAWRGAQAGTDGERLRLRQLVAYTLFAERLNGYYGAPDEAKARAFLEVAAALRPYYALPTHSYFRDGRPFGSPGKELSNAFDWQKPRELPDAEATIRGGLSRNRKLSFTPVDFGTDAEAVRGLRGVSGASELRPVRGRHAFHLWSDGRPFDLGVTGGLIEHYRNRGNVKLTLVQIGGVSETGELETQVFHDESVPPDGETHVVRVVPRHAGLHRLEVSDGSDRTRYAFPPDLPVAIHVAREKFPTFDGTFFFYVPRGVRTLGFYASTSRGAIISPDGGKAEPLSGKNGFFTLEVPAGADGAVWKVSNALGVFRPLTAPPWLNLAHERMLLPRTALKAKGK